MPDSSLHVEGVMDLRGETTMIIDVGDGLSLEYDGATSRDKVIVFNDRETADENIGWSVAKVARVPKIDSEDIEASDKEMLKGIINPDDRLHLWTDSEMIATQV
jgi:purine-binding chemotaxis protein CheW